MAFAPKQAPAVTAGSPQLYSGCALCDVFISHTEQIYGFECFSFPDDLSAFDNDSGAGSSRRAQQYPIRSVFTLHEILLQRRLGGDQGA